MSEDLLSKIIAQKQQEVAKLCADNDAARLRARALEIRKDVPPFRLRTALEEPAPALKIIAEFKRMSPSRGVIRAGLSPAETARLYERGGACAISVLTDKEYFGGSINDLIDVRASTRLPILRKDFIIDPIQIYQAAIAGADAVLLIAAVLDDSLLEKMRAMAEDELGLDALVEVHTTEELQRALNSGTKLIGVNNRDLRTFEVSLQTSERLIAGAPPDRVMISESGLQDAVSLRHLQALGFRGFLVGERLMRASDPEAALRDLCANIDHRQMISS
jgi:indole-3-glycerol phosphate synthase